MMAVMAPESARPLHISGKGDGREPHWGIIGAILACEKTTTSVLGEPTKIRIREKVRAPTRWGVMRGAEKAHAIIPPNAYSA